MDAVHTVFQKTFTIGSAVCQTQSHSPEYCGVGLAHEANNAAHINQSRSCGRLVRCDKPTLLVIRDKFCSAFLPAIPSTAQLSRSGPGRLRLMVVVFE